MRLNKYLIKPVRVRNHPPPAYEQLTIEQRGQFAMYLRPTDAVVTVADPVTAARLEEIGSARRNTKLVPRSRSDAQGLSCVLSLAQELFGIIWRGRERVYAC